MEIGFWIVMALVGMLGLGMGSLFLMGGKPPVQTRPAPVPDDPSDGDGEEEDMGRWEEGDIKNPTHRAAVVTANRLHRLMTGPAWKDAREAFDTHVEETLNALLGLRDEATYAMDDLAEDAELDEDEDPEDSQEPSMSPEEGKRRLGEIVRELDERTDRACETVTRVASIVDGGAGDKPARVLALLQGTDRDDAAMTAIWQRLDEVTDNCY